MKCSTCFRECDLKEGQIGFCKAWENKNGQLELRNYGKFTALALDPIEKKPLAYFHPGSMILSVGSYGCNLSCPFCQNYSIAQKDLDDRCTEITPEQLIQKAIELKPYGNIGIAFTYNEPMISWPYIRDCAKLAHENRLKVVVVTNGSVHEFALKEVLPYVDAFNIDLKGFSQAYYDYVGGNFETVKQFIAMAARSAHVEITTLIVPNKNDRKEEIEQLAKFLASISPEIPLHLTRYFPRWKETEEATPIETLQELEKTAKKYLKHVKLGNV